MILVLWETLDWGGIILAASSGLLVLVAGLHRTPGGGGELRLSVHHAGHHARAVRVAAAAGQDGARVSVWALLLVPELVVVCAEPAAAVSARVGFLT